MKTKEFVLGALAALAMSTSALAQEVTLREMTRAGYIK